LSDGRCHRDTSCQPPVRASPDPSERRETTKQTLIWEVRGEVKGEIGREVASLVSD